MVNPSEFYNGLVERGFGFFCGVPDSLLKDFCACVSELSPEGRHVIAANEGGAVGMACGWHLATGGAAVIYMQNSGEGNAVNPLLSIADPDVYSIPMLLIIGWRGEPGVHDEPQHVKQGKVTLSLLESMGVPYAVMDNSWGGQLDGLVTTMRKESRPVALVVRKGTFGEFPFAPEVLDLPLTREAALEALLGCLGPDDVVVSTTGKASREVFEIREAHGKDHTNDFLTVGGMGHACAIAFGMALGTSADVWCVDGDGSLLMHAGSLAVIAQNAPGNFKYVLNNNGAHESVGGQPTVAREIDVPDMLRAFGFPAVHEASTAAEVEMAACAMKDKGTGALVISTRQGSRPDLGRPTVSALENKRALMEKLTELTSVDGAQR